MTCSLSTRTIGLGVGVVSGTRCDHRPVARSVVASRGVRSPFEVYVNGVRQEPGDDYGVHGGALVFERELRKDRVSGWRWFLGAWGVGTYRQDDWVDVRYQRPTARRRWPRGWRSSSLDGRGQADAARRGGALAVPGAQRLSALRIARVAGERFSV